MKGKRKSITELRNEAKVARSIPEFPQMTEDDEAPELPYTTEDNQVDEDGMDSHMDDHDHGVHSQMDNDDDYEEDSINSEDEDPAVMMKLGAEKKVAKILDLQGLYKYQRRDNGGSRKSVDYCTNVTRHMAKFIVYVGGEDLQVPSSITVVMVFALIKAVMKSLHMTTVSNYCNHLTDVDYKPSKFSPRLY